MKNQMHPILVGILFALSLNCVAPEAGDLTPDDPENICLSEPLDFQGTWTITGSGERSGCSDNHLNTPHFKLRSGALNITATIDESETIRFELAEPIDEFELDGTVKCESVTFTTKERVGDSHVEHVFRAESVDDTEIALTFTAVGPNTCEGTGTATITRR
jgi:hypothetical protein